ncbi:MAG: type VI secretion system baseplate subunit TssF [Planctomycetota bacterium]
MCAETRENMPDPVSDREREALRELERAAAARLPDWAARGPGDPARVLLESFAVVLARLEGELAESTERILPRLLAELGHEPFWPVAASSAVRFHPREGMQGAVKVPAATAVTASRKTAGERRVYFETAADGWVSTARLEHAVVLEGDVARQLPVDGEEEAPVRLFGSDRLNHHLYLGDAEWDQLRRYKAELVLEWPGTPQAVLEGEWEYSSGAGWRLLPVDFSQSCNTAGAPLLRMRIHGPLPDMTSREIEGFGAPWIRLRLPRRAPVSLATPTVVWLLRRDRKSKQKKLVDRPPARLFVHSGDSWQDHSFSSDGSLELGTMFQRYGPAVYLGWDQPQAASLYWRSGGIRGGVENGQPGLEWEISCGDSFRKMEVVDGTRAFTGSGTISWEAQEGWSRRRLFGRDLYWVRACWSTGFYFSPALVRTLVPGGVEVIEGRTVGSQPATLQFRNSVAVLPPHPEGDFEPFDSLQLSVEGGWKTFRLEEGTGVPGPAGFRLRRKSSGEAEVVAGIGLDGPVKARIEGLRTGIGRAGKALRDSLDVLELELEGLERISHPVSVLDGSESEDRGHFYRRLAVEQAHGGTLVSGADYDRLLRTIDPSLSRIEVVPHPLRPAEVWVVAWGEFHAEADAEPCFEPIGAQRLGALRRYLQCRAPLGTVVHVVEPMRIPFKVYLGLAGGGEKSSAAGSRLRRQLASSLQNYLAPLTGGTEGKGCPLVTEVTAELVCDIAGEILREAGGKDEFSLRVESSLDSAAALDLPIAEGVLEAVEIESEQVEIQPAIEDRSGA